MVSNKVIGVGSPHGDDQAGWKVVELLQKQSTIDAALHTVRDPIDMLELMTHVRRLVIVDACRSDRPPGSLVRVRWGELASPDPNWQSTHRIAMAETLQLAAALQRLPEEVILYGIEIEQCAPHADLSCSVSEQLPSLAQMIAKELLPNEDAV